MGFGDAIMATALARGFHAQGKRAAFFAPKENHCTIKWTGYCEDIFKNNPNIARPGQEGETEIVWLPHYKKQFPYCQFDGKKNRWNWNFDFRAQPGEFFFTADELVPFVNPPFIVIEPNIAWQRQVNFNKDWGEGKYEAVAARLMKQGHRVVQFIHGNSRRKIAGAVHLKSASFHQAAAVMSKASLIIAPEGANHHAAAALKVPAVIPWGDWSPAQTMGYAGQIKLTGSKPQQACGNHANCVHCRQVMNSITVEDVYQAAIGVLH